MKAMDVMVRDVVTIGPDADIAEAAKLLVERDISALPVLDADKNLVGIISEADLLHREEIGTATPRPWWLEAITPATTLAAEFAAAHGKKVSEVMSTRVISCSEDAPLAEVAATLERHRIKRVPILRDGQLVGIVSRANLIQALATAAPEPSPTVETDRVIRDEVLKRLGAQAWTDFDSRNIIVKDGKIHIWGLVGSEEERKALHALAENVPGATGVVDELIPSYANVY